MPRPEGYINLKENKIIKVKVIHLKKRRVVGEPINFRGVVWAPVNELGVVFLFGKIAHELGMYVEVIHPRYPDCIAKRYIGKGKWEEVKIEFEFKSSQFRHDPKECDIIVCWEHDWKECPKDIEVIQLKEEIKKLDNFPVEPPDKLTPEDKYTMESHYKRGSPEIKKLFDKLDFKVKKIDDSIYYKVAKYRIMYYSPKRVFAAVGFRKHALNIHLFTGGKRMRGVEPFTGDYGYKWGRTYVRTSSDIPHDIKLLSRSHRLINQCIKNNIPTGWYAELE